MSSAGFPALAVAPQLATPASLVPPKNEKAAREFESQLLGSLLESLQKTFAHVPGGEQTFTGQDNYDYLSNQALATALAHKGGFGIADMILKHLESTKVTP
jgi:Rod binding domain-containing protein